MKLHPASLAVGAALMVGVGILSAQNLVNSPTLEVRLVEPAVVYQPADPKNYVRIPEGFPFTVPSNRLLVMTGIGETNRGNTSTATQIFVDGLVILRTTLPSGSGGQPAYIMDLPVGLSAGPSTVVEARTAGSGTGKVLLGYLADD